MKVGYLGPKGTFSYEACSKHFSDQDEKIPYKTIKETIKALLNDDVEMCIVPIENSLQGCVVETIDTLIKFDNLYVISEEILEINQNLMAKEDYSFSEIKEVYSHPQALAQCRKFINEYLSHAEIVEVSSTALSAKEVSLKNNCACIGNIDCLKEFNLKLIQKNIQDNSFNKTRFWVLTKKDSIDFSKNKMSMIFTTKHKPGCLYNFLKIFNDNQINLTKIESRPAKTVLGEYYFLIDFEITNGNISSTIDELKNKVTYYRILGTY